MSQAAARFILTRVCQSHEDRTSRRRHRRDMDTKERRARGRKDRATIALSKGKHRAERTLKKAKNRIDGTRLGSKRIVFGPHLDGDIFAGWWYQYDSPGSSNGYMFKTFAKHAKTLATSGGDSIRKPLGVPNAPLGGMTRAVKRELDDGWEKGVYGVVKDTENEFSTFLRKMEFGGFVILVKSSDGSQIYGKVRIFDSSSTVRSFLGNAERLNRYDPVTHEISRTLIAPLSDCDHFTGYFSADSRTGHLNKFPWNSIRGAFNRRLDALRSDLVVTEEGSTSTESGSGSSSASTSSHSRSRTRSHSASYSASASGRSSGRSRSSSFSGSGTASSRNSGSRSASSASSSGSGSGSGGYSYSG